MAQAASASYESSYKTVVPVDVYQDVVADLQETQTLARNLEVQNRELWQQNQVLRQEITKFMGAVQQLQNGAAKATPAKEKESAAPVVAVASPATPGRKMKTVTTKPPENQLSVRSIADAPDEEKEAVSGEIDAWNILITVVCIIAVGVSVGYTAFRPK
jgi:peptidoglycan hydrolase CwlO-like protein